MRFVVSLLSLLLVGAAFAQVTDYKAVEMAVPPTIDGVINADEWKDIPTFEGGFDENNGVAAPEKTVWWVGYDSKYIYFAARAYDSDPKSIKANEYRTNVSLNGDDRIGLWLDPFGTLQDDNIIEINPRGATNPRLAGGHAAKREWLGEVLAKGRITPEGYEIEARIPWQMYRIPPKGVRDMRILPFRLLAKTNRSYLSTDISSGHNERIPFWRGVNVPEIKEDRSIKFLPYTYVGYDQDEKFLANAGLDFKTRFQQLDVVGSINPDFRNIENQVLSLDFSYFERLADESRPFFLEGADFFETSGDAPLFVSQRIPSDFDFALKTFGKVNDKLTIAVLDAMDINHQNDAVAVADYAIDTKSGLKVAFASRDAEDVKNTGTYLSYHRNMGGLNPFVQFETTDDSEKGQGQRFNGGFGINRGKLNGYVEYVQISPDFLPRLGFAPEVNFKGPGGGLFYSDTFKKGVVAEYETGVIAQHYDKFDGPGLYREYFEAFTGVSLRSNYFINLGLSREKFQDNDDVTYNFYLQYPRSDPYRGWFVGLNNGHRAGHTYQAVSAGFNYRPVKKLQLNASYQQVTHFTRDSLTQLSANYDLDEFDSVGGRAIQRGDDLNYYLAFRRTGNTGAEYYLIFGDPNAQKFKPSIVLKAVFPVEWKF